MFVDKPNTCQLNVIYYGTRRPLTQTPKSGTCRIWRHFVPRIIDTRVGLVCHEVLVSSPLSMLTFDTGFNFEWLSSNYAGQKINKRGQQFQKILTQISDRVQLALISTLNSGHLKFVVHNNMENIYGQIWWGEFRYKEMEYNSIKLPAIKFKIFVYLYRQF